MNSPRPAPWRPLSPVAPLAGPAIVRRGWVGALFASALLVACNSTGGAKPNERDVAWLVQHGRYEQAVRVAAEESAKNPDDDKAKDAWRLASVAWRLEQGRRLSFVGQDVEALEHFDAAQELAPEAPQVQAWISATQDKLASRWVDRAIEAHASDDLDEAVRCYEVALAYRADHRLAGEGLGRALLQLNYRRGMGDSYYERGTRALNEYWLEQAAHHFSSTLKYDENERAEHRRSQTATLRAENRALIAGDLEETGQYAAARNEYRIATLFDPEHAESLAGLERMKIEERAAEHLREADRRIMKGDFAGAEKEIDLGEALTQRQAAVFAGERERLIEARLTARYETARAIESDHRFEEAIVSYDALLESSPLGYFRDVIARRDSLQDSVTRAQALYEQALATEEVLKRAQLFRQVLLVYPEFRDARQRLAEAEAAAAAAEVAPEVAPEGAEAPVPDVPAEDPTDDPTEKPRDGSAKGSNGDWLRDRSLARPRGG
jgi:tetratricopeptide (TPR) repeat protein